MSKKLKTRYLVVTYQPSSGTWAPMRVFKHWSAAKDFALQRDDSRAVHTYSYWTGKRYP